MSWSDLNVPSRTKWAFVKGFVSRCATFRCPSKPGLISFQEAVWCICSISWWGSCCQQPGESGGGYELAGEGEHSFPGVALVRVMERVKFNFVATSLGHCMMNLDSNARGYREGKCQHLSNPVWKALLPTTCPKIYFLVEWSRFEPVLLHALCFSYLLF